MQRKLSFVNQNISILMKLCERCLHVLLCLWEYKMIEIGTLTIDVVHIHHCEI